MDDHDLSLLLNEDEDGGMVSSPAAADASSPAADELVSATSNPCAALGGFPAHVNVLLDQQRLKHLKPCFVRGYGARTVRAAGPAACRCLALHSNLVVSGGRRHHEPRPRARSFLMLAG